MDTLTLHGGMHVCVCTKCVFVRVQNSELGAEEAFKILHHAFEMIGEPVSMSAGKLVHKLIN